MILIRLSRVMAAMPCVSKSAKPCRYHSIFCVLKWALWHESGWRQSQAHVASTLIDDRFAKGSSFRYLLNNDIYQKLGGRRSQNVEAKDALLDFDGDMTISQQLQLCFCFSRAHSLMTLSNRFGNSLVLMAYTYLRISNKGFSRYAASACLGRPARRGSAWHREHYQTLS